MKPFLFTGAIIALLVASATLPDDLVQHQPSAITAAADELAPESASRMADFDQTDLEVASALDEIQVMLDTGEVVVLTQPVGDPNQPFKWRTVGYVEEPTSSTRDLLKANPRYRIADPNRARGTTPLPMKNDRTASSNIPLRV